MRKFLLLYFLFILPFHLLAQMPDFKLNRTFGTPVYFTRDVKLDKDNFIYLLEGLLINKLDPAGTLVQTFSIAADGSSGTGISLDLDAAGNMYVLTYGLKVLKFSPQGELLLQFGSLGTGPGQFGAVVYGGSLDVDDAGNIYVADSDNKRLQKFNAQGKFEFEFKFPPPIPSWSRPEYPAAVTVGKSGTIYMITNRYNLYKLSSTGKLIEKFQINIPFPIPDDRTGEAIALDDNEQVYVVIKEGAWPAKIHKLNASGNVLQSMGADQRGPGHIWGSVGIAIGRNNEVYAIARSFPQTGKLMVFDASGTLKKEIVCQDRISAFAQGGPGNYYVLEVIPVWQTPIIKKYNSFGFKAGEFYFSNKEEWLPAALAVDASENIYCVETDTTGRKSRIQKFSQQGQVLATFENFGTAAGEDVRFTDIALDVQGNMYVTHPKGGCVRKISPTGVFLGKIASAGSGRGQLDSPKALTVDGKGNIYVADQNGNRVQKFSPAGQLLTTFQPASSPGGPAHTQPASVAVDQAGYVYTWNGTEGFIRRFDAAGQEVEKITSAFGRLSLNRNSTKLLVATETLIRELVSGEIPPGNLITGKIYQDANGNCKPDNGEKPLPGIMVQTEPGPNFSISDEWGNFAIPVDTGTYTVKVMLPRDDPGRTIAPSCPSALNQAVRISSYGNLITGLDFGHQVSTAPVLKVELASNRRRRCFRNITTVSYGNSGFATAFGAQVTVQLPEHISFISASIPHTRDTRGNYLFAVGNLQPNQQGTITLIDSVSCADPNIRGMSVCTKAWITPANTYSSPANWNKAAINVSGGIASDAKARFVIRNTGKGDMTDSLFFRVYQDEDLAMQERYKLAAQDSLVLRFAPTGSLVRVEVDQPEGHPLKATAGASVEVKHARLAMPSPLMMAYPPDDPEPEYVSSCMPILDSFDPNDKQVVPAGLTSEHYTPTNTPLRYTVRFQNTGNDVAYQVVVVDTLASELDLSTLQVGAASHPYQMTLTGKVKPVLTFTFNNIMLPDSTSDPLGSNGFLQFSIKPDKGLPDKAKIENFADIFFDYNEPVRTNTTVNRIYDLPPVVNASRQLSLQEVLATPALTSFLPLQSRAGRAVTLSGRHFSSDKAGNKVYFNNVPATVLQASDTTLTVLVPAGAFSGKISLTTADGSTRSTKDFVVYQPPTIRALSATEGVPGTVITISGTHFSPDLNQDTVSINGVAAKVLEATETTIKAEVPAGATRGRIQLKTLGGQTESTLSFRVWYPPVISSFSPAKGKEGTVITIQGSNFSEVAARNELQFVNKKAEVLEATETRLVVKVPAASPSGQLRLQTPGGQASSTANFTSIPPPVITALSPFRASAGAIITIRGANFQADNLADTVFFNDKPAKVLQATPTSLQVQAPKGVASGTILVAGAGGRAQALGFEVPELTPEEAISIYPNPTKGGITINWFKADFTVERMQVFNAIGKLVAEQGLAGAANDEKHLLLSQFGPGVYTIRLLTSAGTIVQRVGAL